MSRACLLTCVFFVVGCAKKDEVGPPAVAPQDSRADRASFAPANLEPGTPINRRVAPLESAVRGDAEVLITRAGDCEGGFFVLLVVKNRNPGAPFAFKSWDEVGAALLQDGKGKAYSRIAASPNLRHDLRAWARGWFDDDIAYDAGPVTHERVRVTFLAFDRAAAAADYLDLDLDGGAVGSVDPIFFHIPKDLWANRKEP